MAGDLDIAAMDAAQKLAFATAVGSVKLAGGTIDSPVPYLDLTVPNGYKRFALSLMDWQLSAGDTLNYAWSFDGGSTFPNDLDNSDTYGYGEDDHDVSPTSGINNAQGAYAHSPLGSLMAASGSVITSIDCDIKFFAGGANCVPRLSSNYHGFLPLLDNLPFQTFDVGNIWSFLNPQATITPPVGAANLLRIQPYGNGDCNPPTSTHMINSGSYSLVGLA